MKKKKTPTVTYVAMTAVKTETPNLNAPTEHSCIIAVHLFSTSEVFEPRLFFFTITHVCLGQ